MPDQTVLSGAEIPAAVHAGHRIRPEREGENALSSEASGRSGVGRVSAYRPDIDGLRAVAVLPVLFFHAGVEPFSGGFIGVDVFFVISGFLITSLVMADIRKERFSILHFYERRARRILPALFAVMAASLAIGWVIMTPRDFDELARSAAATTLFGANIYFWQALDYFSTAADFRLLLHTWSLAVEEQFYLFWPLFLLFVARSGARALMLTTLVVLAGSLLLSIFLTGPMPVTSFYLLPTRAWELLLGAVIALGLVPAIRSRIAAELSGLAGLALILVPMVVYDRTTPFPGAAAILPCLGTAMLIHTGGATLAGRGLSWRPMVFIGLTSYSLYLWHWPILASLRMVQGSVELPLSVALAAIILSILVSALSWRFIEQPFRDRRKTGRRAIFAFSAAGMAASIAVCGIIVLRDGLPGRLAGPALAVAQGASDVERDRFFCIDRLPEEGLCRIGVPDGEPTVLVWGDSHANALKSAFDAALKATGRSGIIASRRACAPLLGVRRESHGWRDCERFNSAIAEMVRTEGGAIDTIILAARWALNVSGARAPGEPGEGVVLVRSAGAAAPAPAGGPPDNAALVGDGLAAALASMDAPSRRIVILGGVPEIGWDVPTTLLARLRLGLPAPELPPTNAIMSRQRAADDVLQRFANPGKVDVLPVVPLLCGDRCPVALDGRPLYVDDNHLSVFGARDVLGPALAHGLFSIKGLIAPGR